MSDDINKTNFIDNKYSGVDNEGLLSAYFMVLSDVIGLLRECVSDLCEGGHITTPLGEGAFNLYETVALEIMAVESRMLVLACGIKPDADKQE